MPDFITPVSDELPPGLLKKKELARQLNLSPRTIDKYVAGRVIPFLRINSRLNLFRLRDVMRALEKRKVRELL